MTVFISYNHLDGDFAEKLALELIKHNVKVWKDSQRIGVGDSLIQKVQQGLEGARFYCVIFSKNSIGSEWVKREVTAALLREIEQKEVMLLPILKDDIKLPLLVRDKRYADFRGDFDVGLKELLAVILPYYATTENGRLQLNDKYYFDYGIFINEENERIICEIFIVSFDLEETYSIFTHFKFLGKEQMTFEELGLDSISDVIDLIIETCNDEFSVRPARQVISPGKKTVANFKLNDEKGDVLFNVETTFAVMGDMRKNMVLFNVGALISQIEAARSQ